VGLRDGGLGGVSSAANDNYVALHPTLKDKWGIPALHIPMHLGAE